VPSILPHLPILTFTVVQDIGSVLSSERSSAWAPAKPHPYDALIRALARAHRRKRMVEERAYRSAGEIAEAEGITCSFVNRLLRLTLLAPDIAEAILEGRQPKAVQLEELTDAIPSEWEAQRSRLRPSGQESNGGAMRQP
jgi:hypothetical protein